MNAGARGYAAADAANASPLQTAQQDALNLINGPSQLLKGRPLIGNGADGAPGTGQNGGTGGRGTGGDPGSVGGHGSLLFGQNGAPGA